MGMTYIDAEFTSVDGSKDKLSLLVDSGATYCLLPQATWHKLGLKPMRKVSAVLADGTLLERDVAECKIKIDDLEGTTPVILGEIDDEPLLGVITLETLGLVLNPYKRTLMPMKVRF